MALSKCPCFKYTSAKVGVIRLLLCCSDFFAAVEGLKNSSFFLILISCSCSMKLFIIFSSELLFRIFLTFANDNHCENECVSFSTKLKGVSLIFASLFFTLLFFSLLMISEKVFFYF